MVEERAFFRAQSGGFWTEMMIELVRDGQATVRTERMLAGKRAWSRPRGTHHRRGAARALRLAK